jgi:hypothetical protein
MMFNALPIKTVGTLAKDISLKLAREKVRTRCEFIFGTVKFSLLESHEQLTFSDEIKQIVIKMILLG